MPYVLIVYHSIVVIIFITAYLHMRVNEIF